MQEWIILYTEVKKFPCDIGLYWDVVISDLQVELEEERYKSKHGLCLSRYFLIYNLFD